MITRGEGQAFSWIALIRRKILQLPPHGCFRPNLARTSPNFSQLLKIAASISAPVLLGISSKFSNLDSTDIGTHLRSFPKRFLLEFWQLPAGRLSFMCFIGHIDRPHKALRARNWSIRHPNASDRRNT